MPIDEATLDRLAKLARVNLTSRTSASKQELRQRLGTILDWIETTHVHDVVDVEPLVHPADLQTWMRADEAVTPLGAAAVLMNAPAHDQDSFLVPQVVDDNA